MNRISPTKNKIISVFKEELSRLIQELNTEKVLFNNGLSMPFLKIGDSSNTELPNNSIDLVISSPPYCTRIDYAINTVIELSYLRYDKENLRRLRNKMIGTSTIIPNQELEINFGKKVTSFLNRVRNHNTKASNSYYFKTLFQYYSSMRDSLGHLSDVMKQESLMFLVVQDSFYKDLHNDLQQNLAEISEECGLKLMHRVDFPSNKNMANINSISRKYRNKSTAIESVLCIKKV
ncbi:MAG: hypothetical protein R2806_24005 [Saprospiraceae bacterium]